MMTEWYQKSMNALALNGKATRTQEAYSHALRMLCEFYSKAPEEIGEAELEAYFLHRRNVDHWSANTLEIKWVSVICCYSPLELLLLKQFTPLILRREWKELAMGDRSC